jgi:hypothetical protein
VVAVLYSPATVARDLPRLDLTLKQTDAFSEAERETLLVLFRSSYRQANPAFLEKSLETLRWAALAHQEGRPVGFSLGESRVMDLPRLPAQVVSLAGICCVRKELRRRGLLDALERLVFAAQEMPEAPRRLICGRTAHPAALRTIARIPTVVPKAGRRPTPWQREVGQAIAEAYGVHGFDPETFVCIGPGEPIGYPDIEFDVEPHEWELFEPVDRDRGDALLAIAWAPDVPPGW